VVMLIDVERLGFAFIMTRNRAVVKCVDVRRN